MSEPGFARFKLKVSPEVGKKTDEVNHPIHQRTDHLLRKEIHLGTNLSEYS
jgi:hypothetical protein